MGISEFVQDIYKSDSFPNGFRIRGRNANRDLDSDTPSSSNQKIRRATVRTMSERSIIVVRRRTNTCYVNFGQKQWQTKAFVDSHRQQTEKQFAFGKLVLVFQTKMGSMPGKLRFRWTGPYRIIDNKNGTYQVGTLARERLPKWINGFMLRPYWGEMSVNPFRTDDH